MSRINFKLFDVNNPKHKPMYRYAMTYLHGLSEIDKLNAMEDGEEKTKQELLCEQLVFTYMNQLAVLKDLLKASEIEPPATQVTGVVQRPIDSAELEHEHSTGIYINIGLSGETDINDLVYYITDGKKTINNFTYITKEQKSSVFEFYCFNYNFIPSTTYTICAYVKGGVKKSTEFTTNEKLTVIQSTTTTSTSDSATVKWYSRAKCNATLTNAEKELNPTKIDSTEALYTATFNGLTPATTYNVTITAKGEGFAEGKEYTGIPITVTTKSSDPSA